MILWCQRLVNYMYSRMPSYTLSFYVADMLTVRCFLMLLPTSRATSFQAGRRLIGGFVLGVDRDVITLFVITHNFGVSDHRTLYSRFAHNSVLPPIGYFKRLPCSIPLFGYDQVPGSNCLPFGYSQTISRKLL